MLSILDLTNSPSVGWCEACIVELGLYVNRNVAPATASGNNRKCVIVASGSGDTYLNGLIVPSSRNAAFGNEDE